MCFRFCGRIKDWCWQFCCKLWNCSIWKLDMTILPPLDQTSIEITPYDALDWNHSHLFYHNFVLALCSDIVVFDWQFFEPKFGKPAQHLAFFWNRCWKFYIKCRYPV